MGIISSASLWTELTPILSEGGKGETTCTNKKYMNGETWQPRDKNWFLQWINILKANKLTATTTGMQMSLFSPLYGTNWAAGRKNLV